jgi:hypothetical protein
MLNAGGIGWEGREDGDDYEANAGEIVYDLWESVEGELGGDACGSGGII